MTEVHTLVIGPYTVGEKPSPLTYQFQDASGVPINLAGYTAKFQFREQVNDIATEAVAALADAAAGQVTYTWTGSEFATPGHYIAQFWVGNGTNRYASLLIKFVVSASVGAPPSI